MASASSFCRDRVSRAERLDAAGEQALDVFVGPLQFRVAILVEADVEEDAEERALFGGEPDVAAGHCRQPPFRRFFLGRLRRQRLSEFAQRADGDGGE